MKKHLLGMSVWCLALLAGVSSYSKGTYYYGKAEAHFDAARGKYQIRVFGLSGDAPYRDILRKRYGIEVVRVGGCVVSQGVAEETLGYNEVMFHAIKGRFGEDVFKRALDESERDFETKPNSNAR
jgi:hypothetical protein